MELVPPHFMGRTQNTFYFMGTLLQLGLAYAVAFSAHRIGLTTAYGIIAVTYLSACASTLLRADQISFANAEVAAETSRIQETAS
jgi:hypothetical protein